MSPFPRRRRRRRRLEQNPCRRRLGANTSCANAHVAQRGMPTYHRYALGWTYSTPQRAPPLSKNALGSPNGVGHFPARVPVKKTKRRLKCHRNYKFLILLSSILAYSVLDLYTQDFKMVRSLLLLSSHACSPPHQHLPRSNARSRGMVSMSARICPAPLSQWDSLIH